MSLHESLLSSAEGSVKNLANSAQSEIKEKELQKIKVQWDQLKESYKKLFTQPKRKELEREFAALEGAVLSDIDNLKRKVKKLKLLSPEVNDIQSGMETLEVCIISCISSPFQKRSQRWPMKYDGVLLLMK